MPRATSWPEWRPEPSRCALTAPPVEGAANQALVKLLAKTLGVAKGKVSVASGERSRNKRVLVQGLSPDELRKRLSL